MKLYLSILQLGPPGSWLNCWLCQALDGVDDDLYLKQATISLVETKQSRYLIVQPCMTEPEKQIPKYKVPNTGEHSSINM